MVQQHKHYEIQISNWLNLEPDIYEDDNDESCENETVDLDIIGLPNTIERAVEAYHGRAVRALFDHLGLRYDALEDAFQREEARSKEPAKRKADHTRRNSKKRGTFSAGYLDDTESERASTTDAFTSATDSAPA